MGYNESKRDGKRKIKFRSYVSIKHKIIEDLYAQNKLTGKDYLIIGTLANNLAYESCRIKTSLRDIGRKLGIDNITRHIKRLQDANIIKKHNNDYYLNPFVAAHGKWVNDFEYDMFDGCIEIQPEYEGEEEEEIDYSMGF